jgi:hypothetical protein
MAVMGGTSGDCWPEAENARNAPIRAAQGVRGEWSTNETAKSQLKAQRVVSAWPRQSVRTSTLAT